MEAELPSVPRVRAPHGVQRIPSWRPLAESVPTGLAGGNGTCLWRTAHRRLKLGVHGCRGSLDDPLENEQDGPSRVTSSCPRSGGGSPLLVERTTVGTRHHQVMADESGDLGAGLTLGVVWVPVVSLISVRPCESLEAQADG